jgi:peptide/nickel transport system permease protein
MLKLIVRRTAMVIPLLVIVTILAFLLVELIPGDAAQRLAGEDATPEQVERVRQQMGLREPIYERYWTFVSSAAHGDLGTSLFTSEKVMTRIGRALPATLALGFLAIVIATIFAIPAGIIAALRPRSLIDHSLTAVSAVALSVPSFVIALFLVSFFSLRLGWLPATGYVPIRDGVVEWLRHLILPAIALAILPAAELARQVRGSMCDTLENDYITTARTKGLRGYKVIGKHAVKNAAIPIVTVFGLLLNRVLGGAVVVEAVFAYPGIGRMTIMAVNQRDIPVIQGLVIVSAVIVIVLNLLVDISYGYFNPKLRT